MQASLSKHLERIEADPARLASLEERLNLIQGLKRKHGGSIERILETAAACRQRLEQLEESDAQLARLNAEQQRLEDALWQQSLQLSAKRKQPTAKLASLVSHELADLGFRQSRFEIEMHSLEPPSAALMGSSEPRARPSADDIDRVEFIFAPNPGEPPRPLRAVASSGEMARVMLPPKTVLAVHD